MVAFPIEAIGLGDSAKGSIVTLLAWINNTPDATLTFSSPTVNLSAPSPLKL